MSDIHGCLGAFEAALALVEPNLEEQDTKLILLGDYIHGGPDNYGVLDKIMRLQGKYGSDKVIALMGNHEEFVLFDDSTIDHMIKTADYDLDEDIKAEKYIRWIENLPRYFVEGNTIFVHAGIDEEAGDLWEWGTGEEIFVGKYPAETGQIPDLDMKVVAGHVGTAEISGDPYFHDIYYDGASHYYIDGTVLTSGVIPVLMVDTETDKYYRVTEGGTWLIQPYDEEG
ncbi:MAG: metallophosphoesterase [Lachnospiraceae bacterium]|nr:metallophosphoesterase [Lachnospiraceae bacterium]